MKLRSFFILALACFASSCQKEDSILPLNETEQMTTPSGKLTSTASTTVYEVDPIILGNFRHYCQRNAGPPSIPPNNNYPNATSNLTLVQAQAACGPTAYMMAAACIAKHIDPSTTYVCSGAKLASIISRTGTSTSLPDLQNYASSYDNSFITTSNYFGSSRSAANTFIKDALATNKFVIVAVNAFVNDYAVVNNAYLYGNTSLNKDLLSTGNITSQNYISDLDESSSVKGHIIVIVKLTIDNATGAGVVEYIDPLAQTRAGGASNKRYASFSRLLNSVAMNGNNNNYDAIAIAKK